MTTTTTLPVETEAAFQKTVIAAAYALNWAVFHPRYSIGSDPGYPDLTLVHPKHGVVWLELKSEKRKPTLAQRWWLERLQEAGQRAYLVKPSDWEMVERVLRGEF